MLQRLCIKQKPPIIIPIQFSLVPPTVDSHPCGASATIRPQLVVSSTEQCNHHNLRDMGCYRIAFQTLKKGVITLPLALEQYTRHHSLLKENAIKKFFAARTFYLMLHFHTAVLTGINVNS